MKEITFLITRSYANYLRWPLEIWVTIYAACANENVNKYYRKRYQMYESHCPMPVKYEL
jgi:hypothetical protein